MENMKFENLNNPMFKKLDSKSMTSIRGGQQTYSICWTKCTDTLWGIDSSCSDHTKDAEIAN